MIRVRVALVAAVLAASLAPSAASAADPVKKAAKQGGTMIGHMVYFQLKDNSPAAREKLVADGLHVERRAVDDHHLDLHPVSLEETEPTAQGGPSPRRSRRALNQTAISS